MGIRVNRKLLNSSSFRMSAVYLIVFALSVFAILYYVYWNTVVLLERQTDETIRSEVASLGEQYRQGGLNLLVRTVRSRSSPERARGIYLFLNPANVRLAGNLDVLPPGTSEQAGWLEFPYDVLGAADKRVHRARAYYTRLSGGYTLLVGRDIEAQRKFANLIRNALNYALALALIVGIGGGILMSRNFLKRIDTISATSRSIRAGDMSERIPLRGTNDEIDRLSQNLNDMLDQIERLMAGMREVSDNVAHDLKTPLTRLRARVEAALREDSKPVLKRALSETLDEADELLRVFNALLSIARAEAGQMKEGFETIDTSEIVEEVGELYEPLVEDASGTFTLRTMPGSKVHGDRQLLAQAVFNLLDNAMKYAKPTDDTEGKLKIELALTEANDHAIISVSDNGPGIPIKDHERVRGRFVRLDESRSEPGSGLGLSLVAGVAKLHDGKLEFENETGGFAAKLVLPALRETR
ncbi:MAG: ATP-binding protein [Hyphomicrobiales bacterium]